MYLCLCVFGAQSVATPASRPETRPPLVFPYTLQQLLFPDNSCLLAECEHFLFRHRHYNAVALLYQSKGVNHKALDVWSRIGSGEYQDADVACDGATVLQ